MRGIHRSPVNSPHKGQWRGALMFSLICAWMNGWVNIGEAGDLRRHRIYHDVIVMRKSRGHDHGNISALLTLREGNPPVVPSQMVNDRNVDVFSTQLSWISCCTISRWVHDPWWCHNMETFSTSLALHECNPLVVPSQSTSMQELWC